MQLNKQQVEWKEQAESNFKSFVLPLVKEGYSHKTFSKEDLIRFQKLSNNQTIVVCKGHGIPEGFVIIGQTTNFHCSHDLDNAWIIKRPAAEETICKCSPIPDGYVIVGQSANFQCSHDLDNAWIIKLPDIEETVCDGSPIPTGYAIIGRTTNFKCSMDLNNAWRIKKV